MIDSFLVSQKAFAVLTAACSDIGSRPYRLEENAL